MSVVVRMAVAAAVMSVGLVQSAAAQSCGEVTVSLSSQPGQLERLQRRAMVFQLAKLTPAARKAYFNRNPVTPAEILAKEDAAATVGLGAMAQVEKDYLAAQSRPLQAAWAKEVAAKCKGAAPVWKRAGNKKMSCGLGLLSGSGECTASATPVRAK